MDTYYTTSLYPLQDKVLRIVDADPKDFYLTGGTALARGYLGHRYSEDLDFFLHTKTAFSSMTEEILGRLQGFEIATKVSSDNFVSILIEKILKVDFVCDSGKRLGEPISSQLFSRIDTVENILANKLTAVIGRDEPRDVVDIWAIATTRVIDWETIFQAVNSKASGIFPPTVTERLESFPIDLLSEIRWIEGKRPSDEKFSQDIQEIIQEILFPPGIVH